MQHIQAMFGPGVFNVPKNATNTIYVEGIRCDATEREVSRKFKCSSCGKGYLHPRDLRRHEATHLPDRERTYKCIQCGLMFYTSKVLQQHSRTVHADIQAFRCSTKPTV